MNIVNEWAITGDLLKLIIELAKSYYPKEFLGVIKAEKGVIYELELVPCAISGDEMVSFPLHLIPIDFQIIGTVHSHPGYSAKPSEADLFLFNKFSGLHIIISYPFSSITWKAYTGDGAEIKVKVIYE